MILPISSTLRLHQQRSFDRLWYVEQLENLGSLVAVWTIAMTPRSDQPTVYGRATALEAMAAYQPLAPDKDNWVKEQATL